VNDWPCASRKKNSELTNSKASFMLAKTIIFRPGNITNLRVNGDYSPVARLRARIRAAAPTAASPQSADVPKLRVMCLQRADDALRRQSTDRGRIDTIGAGDIGLRLARSEALDGFFALIGR
jgi:hypothetical protein